MPANVRAGQVVGLVEVIGGLGSSIDVPHLADELGGDLATFLPILDAAEMLALVKVEKGDVSLTEFGLKFQKSTKKKIRLLKEPLLTIEPFRTGLDMTSGKRAVSAREIADALLKRDVRWHHYPDLNETLVQALLIHWAIYAELLTYDGKSGKFQRFWN
jgi:NitT/TauT family transport system ATP-binding protein